MHFDRVAGLYRAVRPPYPEELWRDVLGTCRAGDRVLDLGAGTGEAAGRFLASGMHVVAVEPGPHLAEILMREFPAVTLQSVRAENMTVAAASFNIVVAATSIHWMNLDVVLPLVHQSLAPHGRFVVWRNVFGDPDAPITPFRRAVERIVARRGTIRDNNPESAVATADRIRQSSFFSIEATHHYQWSVDLDTQQVRGLFTTFSDWTPREVDRIVATCTALGGTVREHYTSWLIVATPVWVRQIDYQAR